MSLLGRLFRRSPNKYEYVRAMQEMASESERTYKFMVSMYNEDVQLGVIPCPSSVSPATPTGRGVYKARLFNALFMTLAYARSGGPETEVRELINVATGIAISPLQGPGPTKFERSEAEAFTIHYLKAVVPAISSALDAPHGLPGAPSAELDALAEYLHDALADSIGRDRYNSTVRDHFALLVQGNVVASLNYAVRWIA